MAAGILQEKGSASQPAHGVVSWRNGEAMQTDDEETTMKIDTTKNFEQSSEPSSKKLETPGNVSW